MLLAVLTVLAAACGSENSAEITSAQLALAGGERAGEATLCVFSTQLSPENEIRPEGTPDPVESVASGHAQVKIRADGTIEYKVFIQNPAGEEFTAGHIHSGDSTVNGPVFVHLYGGLAGGAPFTDDVFVQHAEAGEAQFSPAAIAAEFDATDICENPSNYYVNYHTVADPMGAIRGQLQ
jgi:hypothetical protein